MSRGGHYGFERRRRADIQKAKQEAKRQRKSERAESGASGPELGTADAYATAAFAMGGEAAAHWTARLCGYEALTILPHETVLATSGFPAA